LILAIGIILGIVIGIFISLIGYWSLAADSAINITIQTITNTVLAIAASIALVINYFSIKSQRDSRRWEVNKGILLKLSKALSDLIDQTRKFADNQFCKIHGIPEEHKFTPDTSIYKEFNRHLAYTKDVYGAVLSNEVINAINDYRKEYDLITKGVEQGALDLFEAYDAELAAQSELQKVLSQHIKKCANI